MSNVYVFIVGASDIEERTGTPVLGVERTEVPQHTKYRVVAESFESACIKMLSVLGCTLSTSTFHD